MNHGNSFTYGVSQLVTEIPILTRSVLLILIIWCLNNYINSKVLYQLAYSWHYRKHGYEFWRLYGLFMVLNSDKIELILMLYQVYRNSTSLEQEFFQGNTLDYGLFLFFTSSVTAIAAAVWSIEYGVILSTLFPAFSSILLCFWSLANSNVPVNYIVFQVQAKYLPVLNLAMHLLSGSQNDLIIVLIGYASAYLYCCLDTSSLGPLFGVFTNNSLYGFPVATNGNLRARDLFLRVTGVSRSRNRYSVHSGRPKHTEKLSKSTATSSNFKGEGRRLYDGKTISSKRLGFFFSSPVSSRSVEPIDSSEQFKTVIAPDSLVVVDFYAIWCAPCKVLASILDQYVISYTDVDFYKVDVNKHRSIALEYSIAAMPTVVFFKNGKEISRVQGVNSAEIKRIIEKHT